MLLSLKVIGSNELHDQVLSDIEYLLRQADARKLKPKMLVVGSLFVEIAAVQALIIELNLIDWNTQLDTNLKIISELVYKKILMLYELSEIGEGRFGEDAENGLEIFFDPEEPYISIKCIDTQSKEVSKSDSKEEAVTKDGFSILTLRFKPTEILPKFASDPIN